jgi:hypothetical protein
VDIEFIDKQSNRIPIKNGKWAENPEPVTIHTLDIPMNPVKYRITRISDESLLKHTWYMNIPPNTSKAFVLLLKYRDEEHCYAFNGQNYTEGFQNQTDLRVESRKINNMTVSSSGIRHSIAVLVALEDLIRQLLPIDLVVKKYFIKFIII